MCNGHHTPASPDNPLLAMDNVVVMPHLAWLTTETWTRYLAIAAGNTLRLHHGEELLHRVR